MQRGRGQRARAVGLLVLLGLALSVALAWPWLSDAGADDRAWARVPPGQSHDGIPLPRAHPLAAPLPPDDDPAWAPVAPDWQHPSRTRAAAVPAVGLVAPPASVPAKPRPAPPPAPVVAGLHLHMGCAWGEPGRNPYRGTPEQVLAAVRLPPDLVQAVSERIRAGARTDRVTISSTGIRRHGANIDYDAQRIALSFGNSLCLDTRVNFAPGHREQGDLYEVTGADGRVVTVMVPDVCGNVSVLGLDGNAIMQLAFAEAQSPRQLPLGGTLGHVLIGLLMVAAVQRLRAAQRR